MQACVANLPLSAPEMQSTFRTYTISSPAPIQVHDHAADRVTGVASLEMTQD